MNSREPVARSDTATAEGSYWEGASLPFAARLQWLAAHRRLAFFLAAMAFLVVWGLPTIILPLSTDEAYYALGGRTVLKGGELYRDFWDIKPPLTYLIYIVPLGIAGDSLTAIRIFDLMNIGLAMAGIFLFTARYFSDRAAFFAACLYCFGYFALAWFGNQGESESFLAGPLILAFAIYKTGDERRSQIAAVAAGLLLGIAVAYKLSACLLVLGLPAAELILRQSDWTLSGAVKRLSLAAVAFLLVQTTWIGYLNVVGTWGDYIDIQRNYTIPYNSFHFIPDAGKSWTQTVIESTAWWLDNMAYITVPAFVGLVLGILRGPRLVTYLTAILFGLALVSVWWQGKLFDYHWIILLPFLAIPAGYAFDQALAGLRHLPQRNAYAVVALLAVGFLIIGFGPAHRTYDTYGVFLKRVDGSMSETQVEDWFFGGFTLNREVVNYIRQNGAPNDSFLIFGFWTAPYWWEDRPLPTRFLTSASVRSEWAPEKWRQELLVDLKARQPRFIAVAAGDHQPWLTGTNQASDQFICDSFVEMRLLLETEYKAVLNNGLFVLYDRKATVEKATPRCVI